MSGHTPGPWSAEFAEAYTVRDSAGGRIAIATTLRGPHGMGGRRDAAEVAANVRLIAAAPDLLEALQRLMPLLIQHAGSKSGSAFAQAIAAVAKATQP